MANKYPSLKAFSAKSSVYKPTKLPTAVKPPVRPGGLTMPGAPPAPAQAPQQAATPLSTGALPIDLQVGVDTANQAASSLYANASSSINNQQDRFAADAGFRVDQTVDPATGARRVNALSVDPTNPYSRAAALQRSYDQSRAGSTNSYASRGQLYAGSLQNAQNENARRFGEGDNSLRQSLLDFYARTEGARTDARTGASNASSSAYAEAIRAAADREALDPSTPPKLSPEGNPIPLPGSTPAQNAAFAAEWSRNSKAQVAEFVKKNRRKGKR